MGSTPLGAKNTLVLMAVGVRNCRKASISFYFTAGTNAETSVLIKQLIKSLHESGIQTTCIVTDGLRTYIASLNNLGCNFDNRKFYLKVDLVKKLWGDIKIIKRPHGEPQWSHVEGLM